VSDAHEHIAPRVLVVDDEFAVRDFVSRTLRQAGYQTETAPDGAVALMMVDTSPPDLVVTDLKMPGVNGADLARSVLRRHEHLRVLFLTAYADSILEQDRPAGNRQAILGKPCSVTDLLHAVSLILFGHIRGLEAG
jgi:CheY-like chemotaxis protein